jgi:hypothetical protein
MRQPLCSLPVCLAADGLAKCDDIAKERNNCSRRETVTPPVVVAVQAVDDLPPASGERPWTAEHYRERDAVLAALGIPTFGRRRVSDAPG